MIPFENAQVYFTSGLAQFKKIIQHLKYVNSLMNSKPYCRNDFSLKP